MSKSQNKISRRLVVKSAAFGLLAASVPNISFASYWNDDDQITSKLYKEYPAINPDVVSEVVGVSHFNLDRLKELVDVRPELAKATWDWGFGDWESAIGAATHVGRRDIVFYLLSKGARPTLFTFAMLGDLKTVKSMLDLSPEMLKITGPHGISLMQHAEIGLFAKDADKERSEALVEYLKTLDLPEEKYLDMTDSEKQLYLGDYKFGPGENDGFSVKLNMRKLLSLGRIGKFGGALYKSGENEFAYNGTPSIKIIFEQKESEIKALTIQEPELTLRAEKVT